MPVKKHTKGMLKKHPLVFSLKNVPKEIKVKYKKLYPRRKFTGRKFTKYVVYRVTKKTKENFEKKYPRRKKGTEFYKDFLKRSSKARLSGIKKKKKIVKGKKEPLIMQGVDWIGLTDIINSKDDPDMDVDFDFDGIEFEGKSEDFPFTDLKNKMEEYLTDEIDFDIDDSYWRLFPVLSLQRFYDPEKELFTKTVIRPMDDWKSIGENEVQTIKKMK